MKDEEFFASKAVGSVVSVVHSGIDSDLSFLNVHRLRKLDPNSQKGSKERLFIVAQTHNLGAWFFFRTLAVIFVSDF